MRKIKKKAAICLSLILTAVCIPAPANAANPCQHGHTVYDGYICPHGLHTFGDKVMNYGVGDYGRNTRYFWLDGFNSTYSSLARMAVEYWLWSYDSYRITTSIDIKETTDKSKAYFEIVNHNFNDPTILGLTEFFMYQDEIKVLNNGSLPSNYGWARCKIDANNLDNYYGRTNLLEKSGTISHELGHAMGLSHQNCRAGSIMCQVGFSRTAYRPDKNDFQIINHLYN